MKEIEYINIFLEPLKECLNYNPKFGHSNQSKGFSLNDFLDLYGSDPFYSWIGLDSPYMFAAHKAAGCMTSVYRQIGIGCERLFRQIIFDTTQYEDYASAQWSYVTKTKAGKEKTLYLDGRLELKDIKNDVVKQKTLLWMHSFCKKNGIANNNLNGIVFEVRQGYKSKDSKRQNGDIDNATVAYAYNYLPVFAIFSSQIDNDIVLRYINSKCGILTGVLSSDSQLSLFAFCKDVLGFDLAEFFRLNSPSIRQEVQIVLSKLFDIDESTK